MIVRYTRERGYKGLGHDPLLTIGRLYLVLGIVLRPHPYSMQVCILTDADEGDHSDGKPYSDGGPGLFDMNVFDIADSQMPSDWLMLDHGQGYYGLGPNEFGGDFWDRFNDGDTEAEEIFEQVVAKIKAFHA